MRKETHDITIQHIDRKTVPARQSHVFRELCKDGCTLQDYISKVYFRWSLNIQYEVTLGKQYVESYSVIQGARDFSFYWGGNNAYFFRKIIDMLVLSTVKQISLYLIKVYFFFRLQSRHKHVKGSLSDINEVILKFHLLIVLYTFIYYTSIFVTSMRSNVSQSVA